MFSLFFIQFLLVWSHILSTAGWRCDALKTSTNAQKHFSHIQVFSYELFNHKNSTWDCKQSKSRCETTNSKPLGPIKLSSQSEPEREQSINTIWLCWLDCPRALKDVHFLSVLVVVIPLMNLVHDFQWMVTNLSVGGDALSVNFIVSQWMRKGKARFKDESTSEKFSYGLEPCLEEEPRNTFLGLLANINCWRTHGYLSWPFG